MRKEYTNKLERFAFTDLSPISSHCTVIPFFELSAIWWFVSNLNFNFKSSLDCLWVTSNNSLIWWCLTRHCFFNLTVMKESVCYCWPHMTMLYGRVVDRQWGMIIGWSMSMVRCWWFHPCWAYTETMIPPHLWMVSIQYENDRGRGWWDWEG